MPTPSVSQAFIGLAEKEFSSVELVESCLANVKAYEPRVQAWVQLDRDSALAQAVDSDRRRQSGELLGVLDGIPIGIKDIIDVAGTPTKAGSAARADAGPADADAPLVANLRAQGAVILGKTVTTEFAGFDPAVTCNPWNLERTPGGSSSGSAAAVASHMCPAAVGSQTGGSIVRPASFCGVYGYKPAWGVISQKGMVPISHHLDHPGPLARSVADLWWVSQGMRTAGDLPELPPASAHGTVGILEEFFGEPCEAAVAELVGNAVDSLSNAGVMAEPTRFPVDRSVLKEMHWRLMATDGAAYHLPNFKRQPENFGPHITHLVESGLEFSGVQHSEALSIQREFQEVFSRLFERVDMLVMPSTVTVAPDRLTTGDPQFNAPWSFLGLPSLTMPIGRNDGLPVGLQLIGQNEARLFSLALKCEQVLGFQADQMPTALM